MYVNVNEQKNYTDPMLATQMSKEHAAALLSILQKTGVGTGSLILEIVSLDNAVKSRRGLSF